MQNFDLEIDSIICHFGKVKKHVITDDMKLCELGYDSFSRTGLLIALEEMLGFEIPLEYMHPQNFETVGSVKEMIRSVVQDNL